MFETNITKKYSYTPRILPFPAMISLLVSAVVKKEDHFERFRVYEYFFPRKFLDSKGNNVY